MEYFLLLFGPVAIYVITIVSVALKDRVAVFNNRGLAIFTAFTLPIYPWVALYFLVKLSNDSSMPLMITLFGATFYYPLAVLSLFIFSFFTRYKWFVGLGIILCAVPAIAGLFGFFRGISPC